MLIRRSNQSQVIDELTTKALNEMKTLLQIRSDEVSIKKKEADRQIAEYKSQERKK